MPPALQFLVLTFAGWVTRHQDDLIAYLREENRVLREHLGPRPLRLTDAQRRRLAVRGQKLGRKGLTQVAGIATPETILRWYRSLIAKTYDGSARRGRGRPMTRRDVAALVVRMAVENPQWGHTRIRGALSNLGHEIARTTVKRTRHDHGIDPAPERSRRMPWKTFLQAHWGPHGLRSVHRRGAHAGRAPAVPGLLRDRAAVPSRSVSRRRVPISTRMPSGSSALFKRSVSVASSPSAKGTCVSSWARTSTTTIASETTRDSTTSSCHDRHRR